MVGFFSINNHLCVQKPIPAALHPSVVSSIDFVDIKMMFHHHLYDLINAIIAFRDDKGTKMCSSAAIHPFLRPCGFIIALRKEGFVASYCSDYSRHRLWLSTTCQTARASFCPVAIFAFRAVCAACAGLYLPHSGLFCRYYSTIYTYQASPAGKRLSEYRLPTLSFSFTAPIRLASPVTSARPTVVLTVIPEPTVAAT